LCNLAVLALLFFAGHFLLHLFFNDLKTLAYCRLLGTDAIFVRVIVP
jgi:hypothetical protein